MEYTENIKSPDIFRRWSGIATLAGALERRVWARTDRGPTYPNLFTLLVGPPATGKYIINTTRQLWRETKSPNSRKPAFHVSPKNMTKASLLDTLAASQSIHLPREGKPIEYHSLLCAAEEFSVLLPSYDMEYIGALNDIWNCPEDYEEKRRTGAVKTLAIENPQLNLLGGYQPSLMATTFPEEAWSSGFARRLILVYASEAPHKDLFSFDDSLEEIIESRKIAILTRLANYSQIHGNMKWERQAQDILNEWDRKGGPPAPTHSKLSHYLGSRTHFVVKLAIISALSRSYELVITEIDVNRAIAWLLEAEAVMPDLFRDMLGKSDNQLIDELHYYVLADFSKNRQKPVQANKLWNFMRQRCPSEKIDRIIMAAERSNVIGRVAGTFGDDAQYIPRPKALHGVE
jgi:hypothetical protein